MSDKIVTAPCGVDSTVASLREGAPSSTIAEAVRATTFAVGGQTVVRRLGFGAMRITGEGTWGPPGDRGAAISLLRRAVELGVELIDTADAYGPNVSEELVAEALHP